MTEYVQYTKTAIDLRMKNMKSDGTTISVPSGGKYFQINHDDDETALYSFSFMPVGVSVAFHVTFVLPMVYGNYTVNGYDELWNDGTYSVRIAKGYTDANNVTDYRLYVWDIANSTELTLTDLAQNNRIVKFTPTQTLTN